jgi:hypothetical protein
MSLTGHPLGPPAHNRDQQNKHHDHGDENREPSHDADSLH